MIMCFTEYDTSGEVQRLCYLNYLVLVKPLTIFSEESPLENLKKHF